MANEIVFSTQEDVRKDIEARNLSFFVTRCDGYLDIDQLFMVALDMTDNTLILAIYNVDVPLIRWETDEEMNNIITTADLLEKIKQTSDAAYAIDGVLFNCYIPPYYPEPVPFGQTAYDAWVKYIDRIVTRYPDPDLFAYRLSLFNIEIDEHESVWNIEKREKIRKRYQKHITIWSHDRDINKSDVSDDDESHDQDDDNSDVSDDDDK